MRFRLTNGLVATLLVATMAVVGSALPAQAATDRQPQSVNVGGWADLAVKVHGAFNGGDSSEDLIRAAIQEIKAAIEKSKIEILNHIDGIANAQVQACLEGHTIVYESIDFFTQEFLEIFTGETIQCATLATEYLQTVQDVRTADNLGYVVGPIHVIAMSASVKAGFSIDGLLDHYIRSYEALATRLKPQCREWRVSEPDINGRPLAVEVFYQCVAYNGDSATGSEYHYRGRVVGPPLDRAKVDADATRNTSRYPAIQELPRLRAL